MAQNKVLNLEIPIKGNSKVGEELFNHQVRLVALKAKRLARVREILGGYSVSELLEILVDKAIDAYDDGEEPSADFLPKQLQREE